MESLGKRLNIRTHIAGATEGKTMQCYSAADIEGHLGFDNRYRIIDFSRSMPPVSISKGLVGSNLFRLFRPEFVLNYEIPLCPDGYSGFVRFDPNKKLYVKVGF
jgi:hypothetical protein